MRGNTCLVSLKENIYHEKKKSALGIPVAHEPARTYTNTLCEQKREGVSLSLSLSLSLSIYIYIYIYIAQTVLGLYNMAFFNS